jgi:hypothetical protein
MIYTTKRMLFVAATNMGFRHIRATITFCGCDYQQTCTRFCMQIRTGILEQFFEMYVVSEAMLHIALVWYILIQFFT